MKVLVIANQKGGIAKTTTATAISSILTEKGYKTLLIDTDQQCNSTDTFRGSVEGATTLYDVILDNDPVNINEAIQHTEHGDIIAGDPLLRGADDILNRDVNGQYRLSDALEKLTGYDFVVIDTAPALSAILHNCMIAADEIIIPITTDRYALAGLAQLNETIVKIKHRQNPKLKIAGLLLVKYNDRTKLAKSVRDSLEGIAAQIGTRLFNTTIRESIKAREAQAARVPLMAYDGKSTTATDYENFVNELLEVL